MADGDARSPTSKVKFSGGEFDRPAGKQVPTQKYNRKEIQKRLEIETWMDKQLVDLFETEVCGMCLKGIVLQ